jgi:cytidylate kinase
MARAASGVRPFPAVPQQAARSGSRVQPVSAGARIMPYPANGINSPALSPNRGGEYNFRMPPITIVTGPPGTGKTAVCTLLASRSERGVHIPSDIFYKFPAHPVRPHLAAADGQNRAVIAAAVQAAAAFALRGYDVFLDGIFGPWFLPHIASEPAPAFSSFEYVILRSSLETALSRIRNRSGHPGDEVVRQMHSEFEAHIGQYRRHFLETDALSVEETAAEILRRREQGDFLLHPEALKPKA